MISKLIYIILICGLSGCGTMFKSSKHPVTKTTSAIEVHKTPEYKLTEGQRSQLVIYSMSLLDGKYTWGGKKPTTGLDCSGLVSYVYKNALNVNLTGNTTSLASKTKEIDLETLKPGDLVFFNTHRPYSHVGLYIGDNKFIHAPSKKSHIRIDRLDKGFYSRALNAVHTLST